jgi:hypothetical protein
VARTDTAAVAVDGGSTRDRIAAWRSQVKQETDGTRKGITSGIAMERCGHFASDRRLYVAPWNSENAAPAGTASGDADDDGTVAVDTPARGDCRYRRHTCRTVGTPMATSRLARMLWDLHERLATPDRRPFCEPHHAKPSDPVPAQFEGQV